MGFLIIKKPPHGMGNDPHGGGSSTIGSQIVHPLAAVSSSRTLTPSISLTPGGTKVFPTVAVSTSVAKNATIATGNVTVIPLAAVSTSVAKTPTINGNTVNPTTGQFIMGSNGAVPYFFDYAAKWTNDAQWRSQILKQGVTSTSLWDSAQTSKLGTATGANTIPNMRYGDPKFVDLINLVPSPDTSFGFFFNEPCFELSIMGVNNAAPSPTGELQGVVPSGVNMYSAFIVRRRAYCSIPEFTGKGDATSSAGISYNADHAASYKRGPWLGYGTGNGRSGVIGLGGVSGGHAFETYNLSFNWGVPTNQGFPEYEWSGSASGPETRNGLLYLEAIYTEQWIDATDGLVYVAETMYLKADTATNWTQTSPRIVAKTQATSKNRVFEIEWMHKNYNQVRATQIKLAVTHTAFFNAEQDAQSADPFGFLDFFSKTTPQNPTASTINSATTAAITATVTIAKFTGSIRAKIDGSFIVGQDSVLDRKVGEIYSPSYNVMQAGTQVVSLTALGLTPGSHTVQWFAVNKAGTLVSASGPSNVINV